MICFLCCERHVDERNIRTSPPHDPKITEQSPSAFVVLLMLR